MLQIGKHLFIAAAFMSLLCVFTGCDEAEEILRGENVLNNCLDLAEDLVDRLPKPKISGRDSGRPSRTDENQQNRSTDSQYSLSLEEAVSLELLTEHIASQYSEEEQDQICLNCAEVGVDLPGC